LATRAVVYVRLIPPGAADTVLPHEDREGREQNHLDGAALLSQVCVVEHAVRIAGEREKARDSNPSKPGVASASVTP